MNKVVDFPVERTRTLEKTPNYKARKIFASVVALGTLGVVGVVTTNTFVTEQTECATTTPADSRWQSAQSASDLLQAKGVYIPNENEVETLVRTPLGGEEICGTAYIGATVLKPVAQLIHNYNNLHRASD
ncbi:MAG TPA: hypothetical protein VLF39_01990 [Candidatus Saccharimonadales bacterium]|nr:hypothetical protein [Candidatus Saccharimonadales bacterium]